MENFVTDTMIIDVRNGSFIKAGDPVPKDAMDPRTLTALLKSGEMRPYTDNNSIAMNPRIIKQKEVRDLTGFTPLIKRENPAGLGDLDKMAVGVKLDPQEDKPSKTVVTVDTPLDVIPEAPEGDNAVDYPTEVSGTFITEDDIEPVQHNVENVWTYDPAVLEDFEVEVLQSTMADRSKEYDQEPVKIADKDELIRYMSQDFVSKD